MDKETLGLVVLVGSALCAVIGGIIRYGLLPYLREQLQQTREIHQQITATPSTDAEPPTMREELTEIRDEVDEVAGAVKDTSAEVNALGRMFDGHLDWAQEEVDKIWAEMRRRAGRHRSNYYQQEDKDD